MEPTKAGAYMAAHICNCCHSSCVAGLERTRRFFPDMVCCVWMQGNIHPDGILTHWVRVTHRYEAIIWTNAAILLIWVLRINFSEILIETQTASLKKCIWKCRLHNSVYFDSVSMCQPPRFPVISQVVGSSQVLSDLRNVETTDGNILLDDNTEIWLTHLPVVPRICVSELGQHWCR